MQIPAGNHHEIKQLGYHADETVIVLAQDILGQFGSGHLSVTLAACLINSLDNCSWIAMRNLSRYLALTLPFLKEIQPSPSIMGGELLLRHL
jgi:hypothetical protein